MEMNIYNDVLLPADEGKSGRWRQGKGIYVMYMIVRLLVVKLYKG